MLELCHNESLLNLVKKRKKLTESEIRYYVAQLVNGLQYLRSQKIIHRDLKLGNLFLTENLQCKIGDFGLAIKLEHEFERRKTLCGTPNYIAPEVLEGSHSFEADLWSLGVILYTLLIGTPPFQTPDLKLTYKRIAENEYSFPGSTPISLEAKQLIQSLLNPIPENRPSFEQVLASSFFTTHTIPSYVPLSSMDSTPARSSSQSSSPSPKKFWQQGPPSATRRQMQQQQQQQYSKNSNEKKLLCIVSPQLNSGKRVRSGRTPLSRVDINHGASKTPSETTPTKQRGMCAAVPSPHDKVALSAMKKASEALRSLTVSEQEEKQTHAVYPNAMQMSDDTETIACEMPQPPDPQVTGSLPSTFHKQQQQQQNQELENKLDVKEEEEEEKEEEEEELLISSRVMPVEKMAQRIKDIKSNITALIKAASLIQEKKPLQRSLPPSSKRIGIASWHFIESYGLGYLLLSGWMGACLNDGTSIIRYGDIFVYINENGQVLQFTKESILQSAKETKKKYLVLLHFEKFLNEKGLEQASSSMMVDELSAQKVQESLETLPHLYKFDHKNIALMFLMSDGTLQVNFVSDHSKILLWPNDTVSFMNKKRKLFTYSVFEVNKLPILRRLTYIAENVCF